MIGTSGSRPQVLAARPEIGLDAKLAFLRQTFPEAPPIETHTAFVFLTPERAFKIKKPVNLGYLDHRSLAARAHVCREEVRLNRQLAPDVYLGLVPLVTTNGQLALGGAGEVVDWLIEMRRLPADRMLDEILRRGEVPDRADIAAAFTLLAAFYAVRQADLPGPNTYFAHLIRESAVNTRHLHQMQAHLGDAEAVRLGALAEAVILSHEVEIAQRVAARLIVEGHGDLRPEHVCLTAPPVIFDRIEFASDMRMIDIFDEVNYLGLECAALGAPWIRPLGFEVMCRAGFGAPSAELQTAYGIFRCVTRARLSIDHLRDAAPRTPAKWPTQARAYLALAAGLLRGA